jgi:hypothetical protein
MTTYPIGDLHRQAAQAGDIGQSPGSQASWRAATMTAVSATQIEITEYRLRFERPVAPSEATHLRGFFGSAFAEEELLHHHRPDGSLVYQYPRVQFKVIDRTAATSGLLPNDLDGAGGLFAANEFFGPAAPVDRGVDQLGPGVGFVVVHGQARISSRRLIHLLLIVLNRLRKNLCFVGTRDGAIRDSGQELWTARSYVISGNGARGLPRTHADKRKAV